MEKITCTELVFTDPNTISEGISQFFEQNPAIVEIYSVSNYITAVAKKSMTVNLGIAPNQAPEMQYQFRFVIVYSYFISEDN